MVKILLKQASTGWFFTPAGDWVGEAGGALDFKTTPAAMDYSINHGFNDTVIVLKFPDKRYDMELEDCC